MAIRMALYQCWEYTITQLDMWIKVETRYALLLASARNQNWKSLAIKVGSVIYCFTLFLNICFILIYVINMYISLCVSCTSEYLWRPEEGIGASGTRVINRWLWTIQCVCWKLNSHPLQEQQVFLTAEPSLHSPTFLNTKLLFFKDRILFCSPKLTSDFRCSLG